MRVNKLSIKKIISTARAEYIKWVCNPRMVLLGVTLIFLYSYVIEPLLAHAVEMNSPLNSLEPFIATINSEIMAIIIPSIYLALMADFPRTDGNTLFFLQRIGKLNWLLGQVLFSILSILTYVGVLFLGSVIPMLSRGFWFNGWSNVITKYASLYPEKANSFACLLIKNNVYNQVSPWYAASVGYTLMMFYLLIIAMIMLAYNCFRTKVYGMLTAGSIIALGGTLCLVNFSGKWIFPMAHAGIWFHYTHYLEIRLCLFTVPLYILLELFWR
jgi:hypothetical protein